MQQPNLELIAAGQAHFAAIDANDIQELKQDILSAIAWAKDADNQKLYIYTQKPEHIIKKTLRLFNSTELGISIAFFDDKITAMIEAQRDGALFAEVS
jgi:hypothetical protein